MPENIIVLFVPSLLAAVVGAVVAHQISSKRSRIMVTNALFTSYHSKEFIIARQEFWHFLDRLNDNPDPPPFTELWKSSDVQGKREYNFLVQVVAFWFLLCMSKKQKTIDDALAKELFAYQFRHWKKQLTPLYNATKKKDAKDDQPDWLTFMNTGEMDWLEN